MQKTPNSSVLATAEVRHFRYEAIGYVATRIALESLDSSPEFSLENLWSKHGASLRNLGFTGLLNVELSEDDGQSDEDIKVFISVQLSGAPTASGKKSSSIPSDLLDLLSALSAHACCDGDTWCCSPEAWELVAVDIAP